MRIALVCLAGKPRKNATEWTRARERRAQELNETQVMGIAATMRDGGGMAPLLVVDKDSPLAARAKQHSLPCMVAGPFLVFNLWRWQRKNPGLIIQTFGPASMSLGSRLYGLCKKNSTILSHAFFIREPDARTLKSRAMRRAAHVLCGSQFIETRIADVLGRAGPERVLVEPGLNLEGWQAASHWREGRHFVFGMAQSLESQSGALMVVRAMAALWQRDDLPPWEVRMFGSGPRYREVLDEAENLGVASRLCLLADQPLNNMLLSCHVWLVPGTNPREFPETSLAGVAADIPLICVQTPLHRERLHVSENGPPCALRVKSNDPQSLARAMISLMCDERLRLRLGAAAETLRPQISLAATAAKTCALYGKWAEALHG